MARRLGKSRRAHQPGGRSRAFDNIFIERLWRTMKYEHIYLHEFASVEQLRRSLGESLKSTISADGTDGTRGGI